MIARTKRLPQPPGKQGLSPDEPGPSSNGPFVAATGPRMTESEKSEIAKQVIDHIQQHARAHGSFSGFADFLDQCDHIISKTRAKRDKLAVTLANSLARDVSSIREIADTLNPQMRALLYRGITTGFLYANLKREITTGKPRPARKSAILQRE